MSKLGLVIVLILMAGGTTAQNYPASNNGTSNPGRNTAHYFVLILADGRQAFYVRLDSLARASSPDGHLILAPLRDSSYVITIGFPGQSYPEQRFLLKIHKKDLVLSLRRQEGTWGLFDSKGQPLDAAPDPLADEKLFPAGVKKDDAFSQMMSAIVRDTAVMYTTYATDTPTTAAKTTAAPTGDTPMSAAQSPAATTTDTTKTATATTTDTTKTTAAAQSPVTMTTVVAPSAVTTGTTGTTPTARTGRDSGRAILPSAQNGPGSGSGSPARARRPDSSLSGRAGRDNGRIPSSPTGVMKLSEHRSTRSLRLVYTDHPNSSGSADTIDVVIPVEPPGPKYPRHGVDSVRIAKGPANGASDSIKTRAADHPPETSNRSRLSGQVRNAGDSVRLAGLPGSRADSMRTGGQDGKRDDSPAPHRGSALPFVNSDCHAYATAFDVDRLKVKMLDAGKDEERIQLSRKVFKVKCVTTKQVRELSEVFATEAGKFKFLETAYPFISDADFSDLKDLFTDPDFAGKFRTLTERH